MDYDLSFGTCFSSRFIDHSHDYFCARQDSKGKGVNSGRTREGYTPSH